MRDIANTTKAHSSGTRWVAINSEIVEAADLQVDNLEAYPTSESLLSTELLVKIGRRIRRS